MNLYEEPENLRISSENISSAPNAAPTPPLLISSSTTIITGKNFQTTPITEEPISVPDEILNEIRETFTKKAVSSRSVRRHKCGLCYTSFKEERHLKLHMSERHNTTGEKPIFECPEANCPKTFTTVADFRAHEIIHKTDRPFECKICGARSKSVGSLKQHYILHTGTIFQCSICGKKFNRIGNLNLHEMKHAGKAKKEHPCQICGKILKQRCLLKAHMRSHSGEKPYICSVCGVGFADNSNLSKHYRIHTGEKPFKCDVCDKSFNQNSALTCHKRSHVTYKPHICPHCCKAFGLHEEMIVHLRVHGIRQMFKCTHCELEFEEFNHMRSHSRMHTRLDLKKKTVQVIQQKLDLGDHVPRKDENKSGVATKKRRRKKPTESNDDGSSDDESKEDKIPTKPKRIRRPKQRKAKSMQKTTNVANDRIENEFVNISPKVELVTDDDDDNNHWMPEENNTFDDFDDEKPPSSVISKEIKTESSGDEDDVPLTQRIQLNSTKTKSTSTTAVADMNDLRIKLKRVVNRSGMYKIDSDEEDYDSKVTKKSKRSIAKQKSNSRSKKTERQPVKVEPIPYKDELDDDHNIERTNLHEPVCDVIEQKIPIQFDKEPVKKEIDLTTNTADFKIELPSPDTKIKIENAIDINDSTDGNLTIVTQNKSTELLAEHAAPVKTTDVVRRRISKKMRDNGHDKPMTETKKRNIACKLCPKKYSCNRHLYYHQVEHDTVKFECPNCGINHSDLKSVRHHLRSGGCFRKRIPIKCTICNMKFSDNIKLEFHMTGHTGARPYECDICNKKFRSKQQIRAHLFKHVGVFRFNCDQCGRGFVTANHLSEHMLKHTDVKPFSCKVCLKTFKSRGRLYNHDKIHRADEYKCLHCGKGFKVLGNLNRHELRHTGGNGITFPCSVCKKVFIFKTDLMYHMRTHTGEKPYACTMCTSRFADISNLHKHLRIHTGEKPYKCAVCGRAYNQLSSLNTHKKSHLTFKPYKCTYCPCDFALEEDLILHLRTHGEMRMFKCSMCENEYELLNHYKSHRKLHYGTGLLSYERNNDANSKAAIPWQQPTQDYPEYYE